MLFINMENKKDISGRKYINLDTDIVLKVKDSYFDTVKSKWVAKIEKENNEKDTIPVDLIIENNNYCRMP